MKILLSSDSYYPHPGGVSEYMHYLAKYLLELKNDVTILAPSYQQKYTDTLPVKRIGKCYLFTANMATITVTFHPRLPLLVKTFVRDNKFDVIHTNGPIGWNLPYWALHYSRAINITTFHTAFTGINLYRYAKLFFKDIYLKKLHGVIYPSKTACQSTFPHFPLPYRIIPNGVDTKRFHPDVVPLDKFPNEKPKILFLGRLDPRKGLDRLLTAFPLIKKKIPGALLIIVGSGPMLNQYKKMIDKDLRNSIYFEGRVDFDLIPRYYATCDIFCSPATGGEVFGIVLTEAMASGKPVVASRIAGYQQVIHDRENGLLFDCTNPQDIAHKIVSVIKDKDLQNGLSERGRRFAETISWRNIAKQVMDYYHACL